MKPDKSLIDRDKDICFRARQGMNYSEIAVLHGITKARVSQICVAHGITRRPNDINPNNIKDRGEREKFLNRYVLGLHS